MSSLAGLEKIGRTDVPSRNFKVARINHRHEFIDWLVDIFEFVGSLIKFVSDMGSGALSERSIEVWMLDSALGFPRLLFFVGQNSSCESRAIVTS